MRVFISYTHGETGEWVRERLVPCLEAGGAEVLIDYQKFVAGQSVIGQMDAVQGQAECQILVFSPGYLMSKYCQHEMKRAIKRDPEFTQRIILPVKRADCTLPPSIPIHDSVWVDLRDDTRADQWALLLNGCAVDLGTTAPKWLSARDEILRCLRDRQSVNLESTHPVRWKELVAHIGAQLPAKLPVVDLENPRTFTRAGLVAELMRALGASPQPELGKPYDLIALTDLLQARKHSCLVLSHFDRVKQKPEEYDLDLFSALRYMIMTERTLTLFVHSHQPFATLLPPNHILSTITMLPVQLEA